MDEQLENQNLGASVQGKIILVLVILGVAASLYLITASSRGLFPFAKNTPTPIASPIPTPTPAPDDTLNWKTYRNEQHGFEFKYPQDKTIRTFYDDPVVLVVMGDSFPSDFAVSFFGKNTDEAAEHLEQRFDLKKGQFKNLTEMMEDAGWWDHKESKKITLNGEIAYQSLINSGQTNEILVEHNGIFQIIFPFIPLRPDVNEMGEKILSTFKFIQPNQSN